MKCGQSMTPKDEVAELRDGYLTDWHDAAHDPNKWVTQLEAAATDCAMHELRRRKLESSLAEAVAALRELSDDAIVLSADYLSAFHDKPDDATVQGWSKAQWVRLLATWNAARAIIAKHSG